MVHNLHIHHHAVGTKAKTHEDMLRFPNAAAIQRPQQPTILRLVRGPARNSMERGA